MPAVNLEGALTTLRNAPSILITSHINPDGDAVGSALALAHLLRALGKKHVTCAMHHPVPKIYEWLPGASEIKTPATMGTAYSLVAIVDVAQLERTGDIAKNLPPGATILVLDHHLEENPDGDAFFIDKSYAATGEIITELFSLADVKLTRPAAECAYVAIATDTGGFRFANTTARSHKLAAKLINAGIDVADITTRVFDMISYPKFRLMQRAIAGTALSAHGRLATMAISRKDFEDTQANHEDVDGLINLARNINGVQVAVLFRENEHGATKISMRARPGFNAAEFLSAFGGGGHAAAAGATIERPIEDVRRELVAALEAKLDTPA